MPWCMCFLGTGGTVGGVPLFCFLCFLFVAFALLLFCFFAFLLFAPNARSLSLNGPTVTPHRANLLWFCVSCNSTGACLLLHGARTHAAARGRRNIVYHWIKCFFIYFLFYFISPNTPSSPASGEVLTPDSREFRVLLIRRWTLDAVCFAGTLTPFRDGVGWGRANRKRRRQA